MELMTRKRFENRLFLTLWVTTVMFSSGGEEIFLGINHLPFDIPTLEPTLRCDEQLQTISRANYDHEVYMRWWSLKQLCHWGLWFPCHWTIDFEMEINPYVVETTANA
ncbi:unnamed protein product [Arabis nemorensis]|uniref:Uncharacterized protein n=1 Tax=Arabis nemorensis TaxID=586526 RepID=A0A565AMA1_9BRAS|nr:unnamed protein product [Arabis nemorensis]